MLNVESAFNPKAKSGAGAVGLAQLMPGTAKGLGVKNLEDPFQSALGGAKYLMQQYRRFGSWPLALAAYNAGPGAVAAAKGIPSYPETQQYVRMVLGQAGMS